MKLVILIAAFGSVLRPVLAVKKCPNICGNQYTPICGHDVRMGYHTFCSEEGLEYCNTSKKRNFSKIADGPCYPSVRDWSAKGSQAQAQDTESSSSSSRRLLTS